MIPYPLNIAFLITGGICLIAFILVIVLIIVRAIFYRRFKSDRIKAGDTIHNLTDGTKAKVKKVTSSTEIELMSKKIINLPREYLPKEMAFIENWLSEEGILQLKQTDKRECLVIGEKEPGCQIVKVGNINVNFYTRNNRTLELEKKQELRTVTLLLMDEWIK